MLSTFRLEPQVEQYTGTDTRKAELEPCVALEPGSKCYKSVMWAMKDPSRAWAVF